MPLSVLAKLVVETSRIDFGSFYTFTAALWRGHDPFQPAGLRALDHLAIPRAGTPPTFAPAGYLFVLPFVALPYDTARVARWPRSRATVHRHRGALILALGVAALAAWGVRGGRTHAGAMLVAWAAALAGPADVALLAGATALLAGRYSLEGFPAFATGVASLATAGKAVGAGLLLAVIVRLARAPEPARA